ncbi:MAG: alpha/beta hydrolase-fold protein [Pirellulales bacterium]
MSSYRGMLALSFCLCAVIGWAAEPPIARMFPPVGTLPADDVVKKLAQASKSLSQVSNRSIRAKRPTRSWIRPRRRCLPTLRFSRRRSVTLLDYAEFYKPIDAADAEKLLLTGRERLKELQSGAKDPSWTKQRGLVARGYLSSVDGSVQPYGLNIPEDLDLTKKPPLYVWLHGRQEKTPDLQFVAERMRSKGKFAADDAITVHPFGRYNNAFKFAGERDVLDLTFHVEKLYGTDPLRRVLMGFSMGGGGSWHLGAHYPQIFCAVAPGAGFSESRRFLRIKDDALPAWYEQELWKWYDAPEYTKNLFELPVIAYSGEKDGQKQAADVMEAEFAKHGKKLNHIIGPNMGHDYDKPSLEKIRGELKAITAQPPRKEAMDVAVLFPHYDALFGAQGKARVAVKEHGIDPLLTHPPIDGAFCEAFVFVMPSGTCSTPELQTWVERESAYQLDRWRRTMRGDVRVVKDKDFEAGKWKGYNVVLWGDIQSNVVIAALEKKLRDGDAGWATVLKKAAKPELIPVGIGPWPPGEARGEHGKYFVLNSGPTFRDEHDKNNANQIPKLPDWAVLDITQPGDAKSPGKVVDAGFFDKDWKYVDPAGQKAAFEKRSRRKEITG